MISYTLTSERIMSVTFKINTGLVTIIQYNTFQTQAMMMMKSKTSTTYCSKRFIISLKNLLLFLLETLTLELVLTMLNQCQR